MTETGREKKSVHGCRVFVGGKPYKRGWWGEQTNVAAWAMGYGLWDVGCGLMTIGGDEIHV